MEIGPLISSCCQRTPAILPLHCSSGKSQSRAICKLRIQFQLSNCSKSGIHFLTRGVGEHRKGKGMSEHSLHMDGKVSPLSLQPAHVENLWCSTIRDAWSSSHKPCGQKGPSLDSFPGMGYWNRYILTGSLNWHLWFYILSIFIFSCVRILKHFKKWVLWNLN